MASGKTNILFILTDQHRHDFAGFSGHALVQTPHLDRLAKEGVVFDNAYCQNPLCVPSRSSLLSGKFSKSTGIYANQNILDPGEETLPKVLARNGYRTCLIGKAHFNGEQFHGYQQRPYGDLLGQAHQPDPIRDSSESGLGGGMGNFGVSGIPLPLTQTEICVSETAKWLQQHTALHPEHPFLLSVNFDKPHFPMCAPEKFLAPYRGKFKFAESNAEALEEPVPFVKRAMEVFGGYDPETTSRMLEAYCACIEWVDDAVGRILETLEYLGLRENTIVIYSSDHGELGGDHAAWNKTLFFDASSKVPLIVSHPGKFAPGHRSDLVGLIDLFPTLCDLSGAEVPAGCEGKSLLPSLSSGKVLARDAVFCESAFLGFPEMAGCMVRTERWKYNYYLDSSEELYDMLNDPREEKNLALNSKFKPIRIDLRKKLIGFWEPQHQRERATRTPAVKSHKHAYPYSNQFLSGAGTLFDAKP